MRRLAHIAAAFAILAAGACSTVPRYEAANDIHAFLVAIRDGDRATFDAHIDRPLLKAQLKSRLIEEGANGGYGGALASLFAGPLVDVGADALLRPEVFRAVAVHVGYSPEQPIPSTIAIGQYVRVLDGESTCVFTRKGGPCVLVFKDEAGVWKLIGFEGHLDLGKGGRIRLTD